MCDAQTHQASDWTNISSPNSLHSSLSNKVEVVGYNALGLTGLDMSIVNFGSMTVSNGEEDISHETSQLGQGFNKLEFDQSHNKETRGEVGEDIADVIRQSMQDSISSMIEGAVVAQPKEVDDWIFVVQGWADEDNALPEDIRIQRENSISKLRNSTTNDFDVQLSAIKCPDGRVSELFPRNLRQLFFYRSEQLVRLLKDYGIDPLEDYNENYTQVLKLVGVKPTIFEHSVDSDKSFDDSEEYELPTRENVTETKGQRSQRDIQRGYSPGQDLNQSVGLFGFQLSSSPLEISSPLSP